MCCNVVKLCCSTTAHFVINVICCIAPACAQKRLRSTKCVTPSCGSKQKLHTFSWAAMQKVNKRWMRNVYGVSINFRHVWWRGRRHQGCDWFCSGGHRFAACIVSSQYQLCLALFCATVMIRMLCTPSQCWKMFPWELSVNADLKWHQNLLGLI